MCLGGGDRVQAAELGQTRMACTSPSESGDKLRISRTPPQPDRKLQRVNQGDSRNSPGGGRHAGNTPDPLAWGWWPMHRGQEPTPVALGGVDESEVTPSTEVQKGALLSCDLGNPGRRERSRPRTSPWLPGPLSSLQEHRDPSSLSL